MAFFSRPRRLQEESFEQIISTLGGKELNEKMRWILGLGFIGGIQAIARNMAGFTTESGLQEWIDIDTPLEAYTVQSSRGDKWSLVMSDEFNTPGRDFAPGKDHLWTSMEMPDGTNAALEYYSRNMTTTKWNNATQTGYLDIKIDRDEVNFTVYNLYKEPNPGMDNYTMYYRSGMLQSWNKFCIQGGLVEARIQLPGAINSASANPDFVGRENLSSPFWDEPATALAFYPTWPAVWLMGNLGRALFYKSTDRMWPWSFNECTKEALSNQKINACQDAPGVGLRAYQGRGAPEIDLLEGGGNEISVSLQIAPGMPDAFRLFPPDESNPSCVYSRTCQNLGANLPHVPQQFFESQRTYRTWYQNLRYAPNRLCRADASKKQNYVEIMKGIRSGVVENGCSATTCPASFDLNGDFSERSTLKQGSRRINQSREHHWGINEDGTCMATMHGYMGVFLCDRDNLHPKCTSRSSTKANVPRKTNENKIVPFAYQMDAISANYGINKGAYKTFLKYQLEWVPGPRGYIRWMIEDFPVFEIPAAAVTNVPQDEKRGNPRKLMVEEPVYLVLNVAISASWMAKPPNPGGRCEVDKQGGPDASTTNRICQAFPMHMKIDYIRVWQDMSDASNMSSTCDPSSHPTREYIQAHLSDYTDAKNPWVEVTGGANCRNSLDCSSRFTGKLVTGYCTKGKCRCRYPNEYGGARCIRKMKATKPLTARLASGKAIVLGVVMLFLLIAAGWIVYCIFTYQPKERSTQATELGCEEGRVSESSRGRCEASNGSRRSLGA